MRLDLGSPTTDITLDVSRRSAGGIRSRWFHATKRYIFGSDLWLEIYSKAVALGQIDMVDEAIRRTC